METLYRKVAVSERHPKEEGEYFTNLGHYRYFYDTLQDKAWWDNHVKFFFEPIEIPETIEKLEADKAELLKMLERVSKSLDEFWEDEERDVTIFDLIDTEELESLIQKHKQ